ncbi:endonuclease/exonuclease/phosphatase family protein [soil metagenome]
MHGMRPCLLFVLLAIFASGCQSDPSRHAVAKPILTVMTYNIRVGHGPDKKPTDEGIAANLDAIGDFIVSENADIVLLQEVDRNTKRSGNIDEIARLAERTKMEYAFSKAIDLEGGEYGIAILSKGPLSNVERHLLYKADYSKAVPKVPEWHSEQRSALCATAHTAFGDVQVIDTHLGITEDQRAKQLEEIAALIKGSDPNVPLLFGGDLNATPHDAALAPIRAMLKDGWKSAAVRAAKHPTFSATKPDRTIDYIFHNDALTMDNIAVQSVQLSDHLPVTARLRAK